MPRTSRASRPVPVDIVDASGTLLTTMPGGARATSWPRLRRKYQRYSGATFINKRTGEVFQVTARDLERDRYRLESVQVYARMRNTAACSFSDPNATLPLTTGPQVFHKRKYVTGLQLMQRWVPHQP